MNYDHSEPQKLQEEILAQFQPETVDQQYDIRRPTIITQTTREVRHYDVTNDMHRHEKALIAHNYDYLLQNSSHREFVVFILQMMDEVQLLASEYTHEGWQYSISKAILYRGLCYDHTIDSSVATHNYEILSQLNDEMLDHLITNTSLLLTNDAQRASSREIVQKIEILLDNPIISLLNFSETPIAWYPIVREFGLFKALVPRIKQLIARISKTAIDAQTLDEFITGLETSYRDATESAFDVGYFKRVRSMMVGGENVKVAFECPARDVMKSTGLNIALNRYLTQTTVTERRVPLLTPEGMYLKTNQLLAIFKDILQETL